MCLTKIVVGMMRAFGSLGGAGPSLFCPRGCPAVACDHEASEGHDWAVGKEGLLRMRCRRTDRCLIPANSKRKSFAHLIWGGRVVHEKGG